MHNGESSRILGAVRRRGRKDGRSKLGAVTGRQRHNVVRQAQAGPRGRLCARAQRDAQPAHRLPPSWAIADNGEPACSCVARVKRATFSRHSFHGPGAARTLHRSDGSTDNEGAIHDSKAYWRNHEFESATYERPQSGHIAGGGSIRNGDRGPRGGIGRARLRADREHDRPRVGRQHERESSVDGGRRMPGRRGRVPASRKVCLGYDCVRRAASFVPHEPHTHRSRRRGATAARVGVFLG